ncbi:class I SAM-dependent methyltransferase [Cellulomonas massiliensis]|uniref:class I SAM-dependent methyltransferase n=1 Tax=Cellulomonas massiliensis TaxID=1465811 RepID=UPI000311A910|nr:class I SAM-dependent methyltransferase [Cellulomonas massiliensis]
MEPHLQHRASSFGGGVDAYAARPGYPDEAARWCLPPGARDVVDVAAGTGKLTAALLRAGVRVRAVEPDDAMRAALERDLPGVPAVRGTAEATGLPDACADAVTVGQAWHWFDAPRAAAELARVLRPGGRLAVLWNTEEPEAGTWVEAYRDLLHRDDPMAYDHVREPALGARFSPPEHATFPWVRSVTRAEVRLLAASRSYVLTMPPERREALLDEIDALWGTHPDLVGRDDAPLRYTTRCWRAVRLPAPPAAR